MQCVCAILLTVACLPPYNTLQYYLITVTVLGTNTENKTRVLIFSTFLSETFLILRRNKRDMMQNVYRSASEVPVVLCDCDVTLIFVTHFRKILTYQIS